MKSKKLTVKELKKIVKEEVGKFEDAKDVEDEAGDVEEMPFADAEISNEVEWLKALSISEFFIKDKKIIKLNKK